MEHTNRTIRPLTQQDLEAYLDIYLNAYPAYKTLDEACREHYREKHRLELREDRQVQTVGLFEGDVLIATMKLILFSMNCFGRMQTACGLMALEVHPLHKKQGAALEMIRYFEDYARRHGALLTLLLPFQISFYRRMGYGFAGKLYEYHLPTAVLPKPEGEARRHLRLLQPEDFDRVLACHSRFAAQNHGMVEKFEEEVRAARTDIQVRRIGYCADDGVVLRALLGALKLQEDLAQTVLLRTGEEDFHHLLEDPQDVSGNYIDYGFLQTNVSAIGTMFKLLDPAAFVTATAYRALPRGTLTAAFCYRDELAHRDCRTVLRFDGGHWSALPEEAPAEVTVTCRQGDLASLLMASCGLEGMVRLGAVAVTGPWQQLAQLLHYGQKPWLNSDY